MKKFTKRKTTPKPKLRIKEIKIQGSDFILQSSISTDGYSEFPFLNAWDVYLPKTVNKGKHNERTELKWISFSNTIPAINKIAFYRLSKKQTSFKGKGDEGLSQFVKLFKEEGGQVLELFNHSNEEWLNLFKCDKKKKSFEAIVS